MSRFLTIFAPPLGFLALLSTGFALVPWVCARGHAGVLHVLTLLTLGMIAALLVTAAVQLARAGRISSKSAPYAARLRFLSLLGIASCGVFAVATLAMWYPLFVISPCAR